MEKDPISHPLMSMWVKAHLAWCLFSVLNIGAFDQEKALVEALDDCNTSNFAKICVQV